MDRQWDSDVSDVVAASVSAVALGFAGLAAAQDYPSKPVKLVVPFPAGGSVDAVARILGQKLSLKLGQQFVIENRPGAGGNIGSDFVAKAPRDGYTLLLQASPAMRSIRVSTRSFRMMPSRISHPSVWSTRCPTY
jgi:tripartite-type tricarboxylate transporter receptor subunit TctC